MQEENRGKTRVRGWSAKSAADIKKRLAKILAQTERGDIPLQKARVLISGANALVLAHKVETVERLQARVDALEAAMKRGK